MMIHKRSEPAVSHSLAFLPPSQLYTTLKRLPFLLPVLLLVLSVFIPRSAVGQDLETFEESITEFTLEKGLHFIIMERSIAPVASFFTFVDVGSANEPVNHTGIAHIFEHMVFKGSREVGTTDWEARSEEHTSELQSRGQLV